MFVYVPVYRTCRLGRTTHFEFNSGTIHRYLNNANGRKWLPKTLLAFNTYSLFPKKIISK